ncbi:response regulator transcription factor [Micromonospora sp. ATCC 39149]|uniref:Response regulator transcription factor n=1 Tax=Micromonospora carbonacea TaxID=47853 RepID=A0A7D6CG43_9ACTN|nr:response regulator transcription factor [Micromonospora sp. ATCC 39149]QLK00678.1 response regulator transcription factor [Micromonospora carbonacea]
MRVLVVEDDVDLAELIAAGLRDQHFVVDVAGDGARAVEKALTTPYDVVVLDRDLPVLHGDDVCRALHRSASPARILMLTASGTVDDRVDGLLIGADDYLPKPFAFVELVARLVALGRRAAAPASSVLSRGDIRLDQARHEVSRAGRFIRLTRKEFGVLAELLRRDGALCSAEELLDRVWDENADPFTNAVRTVIKNLRHKLGEPEAIETVVGCGYRLR